VHHVDSYPAGNEHFGPAASLTGRNIGNDFEGIDGWRMYHGERVPGFPQHPHRGFETVTIVRRGLVDHSDSLGATARYGRGDVQWLTAGRGIVHSEMFPLLDRGGPNPTELFQIWLNLPRSDKLVDPHFTMFWSDQVPEITGGGTTIRVIAGDTGGVRPPPPPPRSWASRPESGVVILTVRLDPGASWTLPKADAPINRAVYFFRGSSLRVGARSFERDPEDPSALGLRLRGDIPAIFENGSTESELLLLQGRPIAEPVVQYGPFVMNTRQEIQQAFADYGLTRFGGWPWPTDDPVHAREDGRFARHADGRVEHARR
jgi:hypothetical protein